MFFKSQKQGKQQAKKVQAARNKVVRTGGMRLKPFMVLSMAALVMVAVLLLAAKASHKVWFPITQVRVNGELQHESKQAIQYSVLKGLQAGFFEVDLQEIARKINNRNWVAESTVRRVWPDTIDVFIREHHAVAVWNNKAALSSQGDVFAVDNVQQFKDLPHFSGSTQRAQALLLVYSQLEQELNDYGLHVMTLKNNKMDELAVQFNNGLRALFSFTDKDRQIRRFTGLLAQNFIARQKVSAIDMRYSNGFSVVINEQTSDSSAALQGKHVTVGKQHV